jgi:hypothetical protein
MASLLLTSEISSGTAGEYPPRLCAAGVIRISRARLPEPSGEHGIHDLRRNIGEVAHVTCRQSGHIRSRSRDKSLRVSSRLYQLLDRRSHLQQQSCYRLLRDFQHSYLLRLPQLGFGFALTQIIQGLKARGSNHGQILGDRDVLFQQCRLVEHGLQFRVVVSP